MNDDFKFYALSGKIDFSATILGMLFGIVGAIPLSFVYAYVVRYIPIVYLNFLISFGYLAGVYFAYKFGEKIGHNRNRPVSFISAALMGLICLYIAWAAFLFVLFKHRVPYFKILLNPQGAWNATLKVAEHGWFSIKSLQVKGVVYYIFLIIEALVYVVGFALVGTIGKDDIFCENCNKWLDPIRLPEKIDPVIIPQLQSIAQTGNLHFPTELQLTNASPYIVFSTTICDTCDNLKLLTAKQYSLEADENNNLQEKEGQTFFENLIVSKAKLEEFMQTLQAANQVQEAPVEEAPQTQEAQPENGIDAGDR